jgi:AcrR family transcriptional regulator
MPRARKSNAKSAPAAPVPGRDRPDGDTRSRLIAAAMTIAATKGWRNAGMGDIAQEAGVTLAEAYDAFPARACLLAGLTRQINETVLAGGEADGSPRERLFELLMRRFDALKPHRAALRAILRDSIGDPTGIVGVPPTLNAMAWMLEGAGISATGWRGRVRCLALTGTYAAVFRTFLADDSEDLGKTMAALDRRMKAGLFRGAGSETATH